MMLSNAVQVLPFADEEAQETEQRRSLSGKTNTNLMACTSVFQAEKKVARKPSPFAALVVLFTSIAFKVAFLLFSKWLYVSQKRWSFQYAGTIAFAFNAVVGWIGVGCGNPIQKTLGESPYGRTRLFLYLRTGMLGSLLTGLQTASTFYLDPITVTCLLGWTVPLATFFSNVYFGRYIPMNTLLLNASMVLAATSVAYSVDSEALTQVEPVVFTVMFILLSVAHAISSEKAITADRNPMEPLFWENIVGIPLNMAMAAVVSCVNPTITDLRSPFTVYDAIAAFLIAGSTAASLLKYFYLSDAVSVSLANVIMSITVYAASAAAFGTSLGSDLAKILFATYNMLTFQVPFVYKSQLTVSTLVFVTRMKPGQSEDDAQVLLALQKRGIFKGVYNGYGGKAEGKGDLGGVKELYRSAKRELFEESGIDLLVRDDDGIVAADEKDKDFSQLVAVTFGTGQVIATFAINDHDENLEPAETSEGKGDWFSVSDVRRLDVEGLLCPPVREIVDLIFDQVNGRANGEVVKSHRTPFASANSGYIWSWQRNNFILPVQTSPNLDVEG